MDDNMNLTIFLSDEKTYEPISYWDIHKSACVYKSECGNKYFVRSRQGYVSTGIVGFYTTFFEIDVGKWKGGDYVCLDT